MSAEKTFEDELLGTPVEVQDDMLLMDEPMGEEAPAPEIQEFNPLPEKYKKTAPARILEFARGHRLAFPVHTTLEIVEEPEIFQVPGAAPHGVGMLFWQKNWIPVLDIAELILRSKTPGVDIGKGEKPKYLLVLAYQKVPRKPLEYCAVLLPALPETTFVDDDMACDLPDDSDLWPDISLSCFSYKGVATPIVDTGRLFGRIYE